MIMISVLTAVQLFLGLAVASLFYFVVYNLFKIILVLFFESSRLKLLFFWELKKYSHEALSSIRNHLFRSGFAIVLLLFFVWLVHLIEQFKNGGFLIS